MTGLGSAKVDVSEERGQKKSRIALLTIVSKVLLECQAQGTLLDLIIEVNNKPRKNINVFYSISFTAAQ
jgi:hypothetical protein